ncbi:hypothetical protein [Stutzerimonas balearica]|uniref:hypothetical protein n=1 Tax=Stutzerimonas balearica TaxID=74829 RepID=UPI0028AB5517|nr:hypothetical protein [Stutzerimonas balearica]
MPIARFEMPDGKIARFEVPSGTTPEQAQQMVTAYVKTPPPKAASTPPIDISTVVWDDPPSASHPPIDPATITWDSGPISEEEEFEFRLRHEREQQQPKRVGPKSSSGPSLGQAFGQGAGNLLAGAVRGAGSIGATILAPYDIARDALAGKGLSLESNRERRAGIDGGLREMGANPDSMLYKTGKIAGEIAGTAGAGPALAGGARAAGAAPSLVSALSSGGLNVAGKTGLAGLATRSAGGAITGAAAAGLVNPEEAGLGALMGGALPVGISGVRHAGRAIRGNVAPEVVALADRAKALGVQIPADRLTNSKPLNALAASLEYMPLSGRAATQERMASQLNRALSRTFGQDSDNVTMALRKAADELGSKFDDVLRNNRVRVDQAFLDDLAGHAGRASRELGSDGERIIKSQIDDIMAKAADGEIDGQAAYNIKKTLDRIGKRNSPEAFYALDLKKSLMGALDRSLGPDEAAKFAATRQQYGNMMKLEKIAKNGAEGDISIARLANMKNVNSPDLQELADIAAQFMVTRESPHGALQRLIIGSTGIGVGAGAGGIPVGLGLLGAGKAANSALNSGLLRSAVLGQGASPGTQQAVQKGLLGITKAAPVLMAQ